MHVSGIIDDPGHVASSHHVSTDTNAKHVKERKSHIFVMSVGASAFSPLVEGSSHAGHFALVSPDGVLCVYDARTAAQSAQWTPSAHLSAACTAIQWRTKAEPEESQGKSNK